MKISNQIVTRLRMFGFASTLLALVLSIILISLKGINFGIDFTGGFITEFETSRSISQVKLESMLNQHVDGKFQLNSAENETKWTVRQPDKNDGSSSKSWLDNLQNNLFETEQNFKLKLLDSDFIGTQIGSELVEQGGLAMLTALIIIMIYLSMRFEWRFALGAIIALFNDVIIVVGVFALTQLEFNLTILASLLAIVGYSLNDSIIVADKVRELMRLSNDEDLDHIINTAIVSTMTRTLVTSGTTLATIASVWWLAGAPLQGFSVALFSGIIVGTFSSTCISATFPIMIGLDAAHYRIKAEQNELSMDSA